MVTRFGMSDKLGNVDLASNHDKLSAGTKRLIELEVRDLIEESRQRVVALLNNKRKELDLLARALVDYETLNKDEAFKVIRGEKLEDRLIMPAGNIKIPMGTNPPSHVPGIPGSKPEENPGKPPPQGGLVA
jgi:ATP-dependent metalloprotease